MVAAYVLLRLGVGELETSYVNFPQANWTKLVKQFRRNESYIAVASRHNFIYTRKMPTKSEATEIK
jgi:hypothetical protein